MALTIEAKGSYPNNTGDEGVSTTSTNRTSLPFGRHNTKTAHQNDVKFVQNDEDDASIRIFVLCVIILFSIISSFLFPRGPFTTPHPAFWRIVFGLSILYLVLLIYCMFQSYKEVEQMIYWYDPEIENFDPDIKDIEFRCSEVNLDTIWWHLNNKLYISHFFGWVLKVIIVRHLTILWVVSVMWEFTEIAFAHILKKFSQCWWESYIIDVLISNGLGIWAGLRICKLFKMKKYRWLYTRNIKSTKEKHEPDLLLFTPSGLSQSRWITRSSDLRLLYISVGIIIWLICELNTFFLYNVFEVPRFHSLMLGRTFLHVAVAAPSIRQYYEFVTEPTHRVLGIQCWVWLAIIASETNLCIIHGYDFFKHTKVINICVWLLVIVFLSYLCIYGSNLRKMFFQYCKNHNWIKHR